MTAEPRQPPGWAQSLFEWAQSLAFAFVIIVLIFAFGAGVFSVSRTSMINTLEDGEMVMISRLPYTPKRGDIVLFVKYGWQSSYNEETGAYNPLVKRIIGLPGDTIDFVMEGDAGTLYLNGEALEEPYIREPMTRWAASRQMPLPLTVPEGNVFVMGDNRNYSHDSRSDDIGFIDRRSILGPLVLRLTPLSRFGRVVK